MTSRELENLVEIGQLKRAPINDDEIDGLIRSGEARLTDAGNTSLALESRFDLAYNAAHALDDRLVTDLIAAAGAVRDALRSPGPPA